MSVNTSFYNQRGSA